MKLKNGEIKKIGILTQDKMPTSLVGGNHDLKRARVKNNRGTYRLSFLKQKLVPSQCEITGFPPLDELPSDLFLFQFSFDERLAVLIYNCRR